jgi:hypothetical protein
MVAPLRCVAEPAFIVRIIALFYSAVLFYRTCVVLHGMRHQL